MRAPQARVEALCDALLDDCRALSVSVEDADAGGSAERALFGEPGMPSPAPGWERSTLTALFDDNAAAEEAAAMLRGLHGGNAATENTSLRCAHFDVASRMGALDASVQLSKSPPTSG